MIHIITSSRYRINRKRIVAYIEGLLKTFDVGSDMHLNCIFVGKTKMKSIASRYKKENVALPVLSFSYKDEPFHGELVQGEPTHDDRLLGEVFLCYPQVVLLAAERNKKVEDMIDAMIKHGVENLLK